MRGDIPMTVTIDDRPCEAHGTYGWSGGGSVLTLSTVLPERGLAAELISTYVGHTDTPTIATAEHALEDLCPVESARECAYDHAHRLIEVLGATGRHVSVQLDERSFTQLERVE